jgi:hypothetical protein
MSLRGRDDPELDPDAWTAFRYASGALDAAEADAFEDRLATDPAACEQLVQAVRLIELTRQAAAQVPTIVVDTPRRPRLTTRLATLCAAAAATVAVYVAAGGFNRPATPSDLSQTWASLAPQTLPPAPDPLLWDSDPSEPDDPDAVEPLPAWILEIASLDSPAEPTAEEGHP